MNTLTECDLVYTTDLELSEAFLRKNLKDAEEELHFEETCKTYIQTESTDICVDYYNTIEITRIDYGKFDCIDFENIYEMYYNDYDYTYTTIRAELTTNRVYITDCCVSITIPKYLRSFGDLHLSRHDDNISNYVVTLKNSHEYTNFEDCEFDVIFKACDVDENFLGDTIIAIIPKNSYKVLFYASNDVCQMIYICSISDNERLLTIPIDEIIIHKKPNIFIYEVDLSKYIIEHEGLLYVEMLCDDIPDEYDVYVADKRISYRCLW